MMKMERLLRDSTLYAEAVFERKKKPRRQSFAARLRTLDRLMKANKTPIVLEREANKLTTDS